MAKHFTKKEIDEIEQALIERSKKDSSLPEASALSGDELIPIVQKGENKTMTYSALDEKITHDAMEYVHGVIDSKVDKVPGKGLSTNDYDNIEKQKVAEAYHKPSSGIPASDIAEDVIPDVSQFITRTVNDLVNYYLKSEVYNKLQVDSLIAAVSKLSYVFVDVLPEASDDTMNKIYLVPSSNPKLENVKDEFFTIHTESQGEDIYYWEQFGSTSIDLDDYITTEELNTALASYTTTANLTELLSQKQDVISDLSSIRSGAVAGSTAYQKPSSGIPKSDLIGTVQTSLDKADSSLQFTPSGEVDPQITPADYATRDDLNQLGQHFPDGTPNNFSVVDEYGYAILKLLSYLSVDENGNIKTKGFNSDDLKLRKETNNTLSFVDNFGNAILHVDADGNIKTKSFDSSKSIFIIVDINGKGDYTSLEDAIKHAGDSYSENKDITILVMPGTYQMTEIATPTTQLSFGNRNLNIIGVDREKCIIRGDNGYYSTGYETGSPGFADSAPLKLAGNCYVANLTIISTDDNFQMQEGDTGDANSRHTAYCIHIDYYNNGRWTFHIHNCILKNDHYACIGCGLRGNLIVTDCIMECTMYDPAKIRGCIYAHDSGQIDVPGPYDVVEVFVKNCILTGNSGAPLTFFDSYHKTIHLTFAQNIVFNEQGGDVLIMDSTYHDITKYSFGNNNSELNYIN